jgi:hypothetical protein
MEKGKEQEEKIKRRLLRRRQEKGVGITREKR